MGPVIEPNQARAVAFDAGFDFARRLRDEDFRAFLMAHGWRSGQHVVVAAPDEPVVDVVSKMILHDTDGRALIAIPTPSEAFGFRFILAIVAPRRYRWLTRRAPSIEIARTASIGMLYSALEPCGEYVPNEWTRPVLFERV